MGKKDNDVFQRVEKKYILTAGQYPAFVKRIAPYMTMDQYGYHTICNLYYDTERDELVRRSIEGPIYKEKLRLRTYGIPDMDQESFIELKKKYEKVVYKRRASVPYSQAVRYLNHGVQPGQDSQILREIEYFRRFYKPEPKLFLAYDREAFAGNDEEEFRLTIDHNIRFREENLDLTKGDAGTVYFENGEKVLEIKVSGSFPLWLSASLAELKIYPVSFSKYGSIYKKTHLQKEYEPDMKPYLFAPGGYALCSQV